MHVLIATQPLGLNYGGILQAYALQRVVRSYVPSTVTTFSQISFHPKQLITRNNYFRRLFRKPPIHNEKIQMLHTSEFIAKYIDLIPIKRAKQLGKSSYFGCVIVGSDQVWRKSYANVLENMFSYIPPKTSTKISYAASFGRSDLLGYNKKLVQKSKHLAADFSAISVREDSAIELVKDNWQTNATRHVDPTLLLTSTDYSDLITRFQDTSAPAAHSGIFSYILDPSPMSREFLKECGAQLEAKMYQIISGDGNAGQPLPPVEEWLRCFKEADYVITDSFHGTVFSILFNKQFLAIQNENRGAARFETLLKTLGLQERLVPLGDASVDKLRAPINWKEVNRTLDIERRRGINYLKRFLISSVD